MKHSLLPWMLLLSSVSLCVADVWSDLNLPDEHIPYFFYSNEDYRTKCVADDECPYKEYVDVIKCWGYEKNCTKDRRMTVPYCTDRSQAWKRDFKNMTEEDIFWQQGDFGYVKIRLDELAPICEAQEPDDSYLVCSNQTKYCKGQNIYMDFRLMNFRDSKERFLEDVFQKGQIGGHCLMNKTLLRSLDGHKSPLQSWYAELQNFDSLPYRPIAEGKCDITFDKPVIVMKLDAAFNLYHHYCDYINLYATNHLNNTFHTDVQIIMWDTTVYNYAEIFQDTWKAFTHHPLIPLHSFVNSRVCFRDIIFPLLPRMRRGLFYNTPLIPHCQRSSLFRAFSQHLMHRLNITQKGPLKDKIRITFQARTTKFRRILNLADLADALKAVPEYEVTIMDYNFKEQSFLEQVKVSHNSDVFMGMHGAGLTHMLFQPDWGSVFEIYNCEDINCYKDLARLRGLHYVTWVDDEKAVMEVPRPEGHKKGIDTHAKFTNYYIDVDEFMNLVRDAVQHVRDHPSYQEALRQLYGNASDSEKKNKKEEL